jgi:hypothetical protein
MSTKRQERRTHSTGKEKTKCRMREKHTVHNESKIPSVERKRNVYRSEMENNQRTYSDRERWYPPPSRFQFYLSILKTMILLYDLFNDSRFSLT